MTTSTAAVRPPKPLRVALLTDSAVFAGTERHMLDLASGLRGEGVEASLACPCPSGLAQRAEAEGLPVLPLPGGGAAAVRVLARLLRKGEVDLVHAHNGRTALLAAVAVRLAGKGRAVATQHFLEPAHVARRGLLALLSRVAHCWVERQMSHFIAISEAAKTAMLARGEGTAANISVVPNGMPQPDLARLASPESIRAGLGIEPGATLIVAVARLEREKNLETLVAAMRLVVLSEPSAVCVIAGAGSQEGALCSQIAIGGLERSVRLLGFQTDTLALMRAGDLFILPSAREPFGLVLIEAMSVGKPVIATGAGGPLEIVIQGETGLLVAVSDAREFAGALIALVRDPERRRRMGEAGHARFLSHFTVSRMARATIETYAKALGQ